MGVQLGKDSVDLGIVVRDGEAALRFYRDTLGLDHAGDMQMGGGATMHRLMCGTSVIKLVHYPEAPQAANPTGGINAASGYRYWTITVTNLDQMAETCQSAGYQVAVTPREIRPGVRIAMVEDPDGNWVELLENT